VSERKLADEDLRRLLREAMPDDLPADLAGPLRASLRPAFHRAVRELREARTAPTFGSMVQTLLPAAAAVMIAAGVTLQTLAPPRALAESLALHKTASGVTLRLAEAGAMRCVVDTTVEGEPGRRYRIDWEAARGTHLRVEGADGTPIGELTRSSAVPRTLGRASERTAAPSPGEDPEVRPVRDLLSPSRIAALLEGGWRVEQEGTGASPLIVLSVSRPTDPAVLRMALDSDAMVPVWIESTATSGARFRARCEWSLPSAGSRLLGNLSQETTPEQPVGARRRDHVP